MVDLKLVRERPDEFKEALRRKGADPALIDLDLDRRRRSLVHRVETLRAAQNKASEVIARLTGGEREAQIAEMKRIARDLRTLEPELRAAEQDLERALLRIPNPPHPSVPEGGPEANVVLRTVGTPPTFPFPPRDHVELGALLDILDVERGAKVSGSRFVYLRREGALLQMA